MAARVQAVLDVLMKLRTTAHESNPASYPMQFSMLVLHSPVNRLPRRPQEVPRAPSIPSAAADEMGGISIRLRLVFPADSLSFSLP
jgi:hypothetical protein